MEKLKSAKAISVVLTALFVASMLWLANTKRMNSSLQAGLEKERLKSEQLLSEKMLLEKEMRKFKDHLFQMKTENMDLKTAVQNASQKLAQQESEYNRMKKENLSLGSIKKQKQELLAIQHQLENEMTSLRSAYELMEAKNKTLTQTIAGLEERNKLLNEDLNKALFASIDHAQIQALKGKGERLTVRARKTKKLVANFEVPANLKNISFLIVDAQGKAVGPNDGTIAFTTLPSDKNLTASTVEAIPSPALQKLEMVYTPKNKLKGGIYTVEILNENLHIGSMKVKLR